jgi:hypothetical protein
LSSIDLNGEREFYCLDIPQTYISLYTSSKNTLQIGIYTLPEMSQEDIAGSLVIKKKKGA